MVAVNQWSDCRPPMANRRPPRRIAALPEAIASPTHHFEVLDFLGLDLCMRIRREMCSLGSFWFHFSCELDSIFVLVRLDWGGG